MRILLILFIYSSIYAAQYCNGLAKAENWEKDGVIVKNIVNEFPKSHRALVNFLDTLPIENSEIQLLSRIKENPSVPVIRVWKDSPRFQWEINKDGSTIGIVIHYYKGCVSKVMLMDVESSNIYFRNTFLSQQKL